mgnify:CR=1 FL=1|jgi:hypothetical protein
MFINALIESIRKLSLLNVLKQILSKVSSKLKDTMKFKNW